MRISSTVDYAVRACAELAAADPVRWTTADSIADAQTIPVQYLPSILATLRAHGLVESKRGVDGGHRLARAASEISVADVVRAIDGPLASVAGTHVEDLEYVGAAEALLPTWVAMRVAMRGVLEQVSLAQLASGRLPRAVTSRLVRDDAWTTRPMPG